jgi:cellobiose epimerase
MRLGYCCLLALVLWPAASKGDDNGFALGPTRERLERLLLENIVPFWDERIIDRQHGGYRLNHDIQGKWLGPADKALVTQARTVWFLARLYNSGYGGDEALEAARHGFIFLRDRLWDAEHGGFYWSVSADGTRAVQDMKHLYGQGFALYALTEYGQASGDPQAQAMAARLFRLLEFYAYDTQYGGYQEFFTRTWDTPPEGSAAYVGGAPKGAKLMNTHLHLMEPFTTYVQWSGLPLARQRLTELIFIQSSAVVRMEVGACTDKYAPDWTPLLQGDWARVSYGHDLENTWLLSEANRAAGLPDAPLLGLYRTLVDYALEHGYDRQAGGFFDSGPLGQAADRLDKVWWVQAEALVALLNMYSLTGEQPYADAFLQTLSWVEDHQTDWKNGDWFATIESGQAAGAKAGPWKSPYHNGRAVIECLEILQRIERVEQ